MNKKILLLLLILVLQNVMVLGQISQNNTIINATTNYNPNKAWTLQYNGSIEALEGLATIIKIVGKHKYLVTIDNPQKLIEVNGVILNEVNPTDKLNYEYLNDNYRSGDEVMLQISLTTSVPSPTFINRLAHIGGTLSQNEKEKKANWYRVTIDYDSIMSLARLPEVVSIDVVGEDITMNQKAVAITNTSIAYNGFPNADNSLQGKGVIIGVGDDSDPSHIDVDDRIIENFSHKVGSGHGIHTTVTTGGAGLLDEKYRGFAPKSSLIGQFFSGVLFYGEDMYNDYGMRITNNSYANNYPSCPNFGYYNMYSEFVDSQTIKFPKLLHVFAAGNYATYTCEPFPSGYGTVAASYQSAKNPLVVGNLARHIYQYNNTTSRGPTRDGRLKPEIMAQGTDVISGGHDNTYYSNSGTSMAAPNVAGAAALLHEQYKKMYGVEPYADIIKTILMNGSQDIYNPYPDYISGFGLMDVKQSLTMLINNQYFVDSIANSVTKTYNINVPAHVSKLKVMLYWSDAPIAPLSDTSLINDLDLSMPLSTGLLRPWVLNPNSPAANAIRSIDRLNNVEQITIDNPASGVYPINVNAHFVMSGKQRFVLAYDMEMDSLKISFPNASTRISTGDSFFVYYKMPQRNNNFVIGFSNNNGLNWITLNGNYPDSLRHYLFTNTDTINSTQCKIRITEQGTGITAISETFSITKKITVTVDSEINQCPGSFSIIWDQVPTATHYVIFRNIDGIMQAIDTVNASQLNYTISRLNNHKEEWLAVAPIINGKTGIRSNAVSRIPNNGSCLSSSIPERDLVIVEISKPESGRQWANSQLTSNEYIYFKIQNRGYEVGHAGILSVRINGVLMFEEYLSFTLYPGQVKDFVTNSTVDLSSIGDYNLEIKFSPYMDSTIGYYDKQTKVIKHLPNPVIDKYVGYSENFESVIDTVLTLNKNIGITGALAWDYFKDKGFGRLRSRVMSSNNIQGNKSMSMDLKRNSNFNLDSQSVNQLMYTANLSELNVNADEMRFSFLYRYAGTPKFYEENAVFIRSNENAPWIKVEVIDTTDITTIKKMRAISLNDFFNRYLEDFSTTTQIMIQQKDTSLIVGPDYGNGLTIDSFRLFMVNNDVSIDQVLTPNLNSCYFPNEENFIVNIRNNVFTTANNIAVHYQVNNGPVFTEMIPSIPPKTTIEHQFESLIDFTKDTIYNINAWISMVGDENTDNDSILNYTIYKKPIIASATFYFSFENNSTNPFYVRSASSGWSLGSSNIMSDLPAANGVNAWHTQKSSQDGIDEISYLYSQCFDINSFANPYLSFSFTGKFPDVSSGQQSNTYCYLECSIDGSNWEKMDQNSKSFNWYQGQWNSGYYPWQVATYKLPTCQFISFRIVYRNNSKNPNHSFAIDDLHIYNNGVDIIEEKTSFSEKKNINANSSVSFVLYYIFKNYLLGKVTTTSSSLDNAHLVQYNHQDVQVSNAMDYIFPTNFVLKATETNTDTLLLELSVPHKSFVDLQAANSCEVCVKVPSPYMLGITNYNGPNLQYDSSLENNTDSSGYTFIKKENIEIIPYMNGYIFKFKTNKLGEYWFNDGGLNRNNNIIEAPIVLTGQQLNNATINLKWYSSIDSFVNVYTLQRKDDMGIFQSLIDFNAASQPEYTYEHLDNPTSSSGIVEYRVVYLLKNNTYRATNTVLFGLKKFGIFNVNPNPINTGSFNLSYYLKEVLPIHFKIIDMSGKVMYNTNIEPSTLIGNYTFDMNRIGLSPGVYIFSFQSGLEKENKKIVFLK